MTGYDIALAACEAGKLLGYGLLGLAAYAGIHWLRHSGGGDA